MTYTMQFVNTHLANREYPLIEEAIAVRLMGINCVGYSFCICLLYVVHYLFVCT